MANTLNINNSLVILCFILFPFDSYAQSEKITTEINIENRFLNKDKSAIKKIVFQSTAFLLRSVGKSQYSSAITNDHNHKFIIEQNIRFYKEKNFFNEPEEIKIYFHECFLINSFILENNPDSEKLIELDEKRKKLKNDLNKYLSQYNIEYDRIIFKITGKTENDLIYPFVEKAFKKYSLRKINMNDPDVMEKVIKDAYVDLADFLDSESLK